MNINLNFKAMGKLMTYKQFMENKTMKQVNEGAGAGYTIEGIIRNINLGENAKFKKVNDDTFVINGGITCNVEVTKAQSYEYGGDDKVFNEYNAAAKISNLEIHVYDMRKGSEEEIKEDLRQAEFKFKYIYGAGWSHVKFGGDLKLSDVDTNDWSNSQIINGELQIEDEKLCDFVDKVVCGGNTYTAYTIRCNGDLIEQEFKTEKEAIEYAKKNLEPGENVCNIIMDTDYKDINGEIIGRNSDFVYKF